MKASGKRRKLLKVAVKISLLVVLIAGVILIVLTWPDKFGLSREDSRVDDVDALITEVGSLILLPQDEIPTIASVTQKDLVRGESFFRNAANGDRVLIYTNAKKAFLYRPSEKKIIEVGVVNLNEPVNQLEGIGLEEVESPSPTQVPGEVSPTTNPQNLTPTITPIVTPSPTDIPQL